MKKEYNYTLTHLNTFGINAVCKQMFILDSPEEITQLIEEGVFKSLFYILGGGSNTLFTGDFDGSIIQLQNKEISVVEETENNITLKVAAGETWQSFIQYCLQNNLYGAENLIDIPGWVGSAPVQNIGAYGVEVKDMVKQVNTVLLTNGEYVKFNNRDCQFGYRNSVFKTHYRNRLLITSVLFQLSKKPNFNLKYAGLKEFLATHNKELSLQNIAKAVQTIRASKLPDLQLVGSAGSFFKNPLISQEQLAHLLSFFPDVPHYTTETNLIKISAAYLIEQCGLKGYREGKVGIYPKQALVIVNWGNATGQEIKTFYHKVQTVVMDKFGILLEPEVNEI